MMNDDLAAIAGKYEELVGKLQERYGIASEKAKRQVDDFRKVVGELKKSNTMLRALQARHKKAKPAPRTSRARKAVGKRRRTQVGG
jgi:hypothetical protein